MSKKAERKYAIITCKRMRQRSTRTARRRRSGEDDDDDDDFKYSDYSSSSAILNMLEERKTKERNNNHTSPIMGSNKKHGTNIQDYAGTSVILMVVSQKQSGSIGFLLHSSTSWFFSMSQLPTSSWTTMTISIFIMTGS